MRGVVCILLAAVLFGSNPSVEALLLGAGLPSTLIAFWVIAVSGGLALLLGAVRRESFRLTGRQLRMMVLAGAVGRGMTEIFLVMAYTMVPAGVATMVHFFFPTIVCIAAIVIFHEKWAWHKAAAILLSVCGLSGIAGGVTGASIIGILCAGITSFTFAFYYLVTERSCIRDLPPMAMLFYLHLFAGIASAAVVAVRHEWVTDVSPATSLILFASGLICFLGFVFLNTGIPLIGAGAAAFINMLEPVTSVLLSVLLFHQTLSARTAAGCVFIVCALFVSAAGEYGPARMRPEKKTAAPL